MKEEVGLKEIEVRYLDGTNKTINKGIVVEFGERKGDTADVNLQMCHMRGRDFQAFVMGIVEAVNMEFLDSNNQYE